MSSKIDFTGIERYGLRNESRSVHWQAALHRLAGIRLVARPATPTLQRARNHPRKSFSLPFSGGQFGLYVVRGS
jgi:hypothetical protein